MNKGIELFVILDLSSSRAVSADPEASSFTCCRASVRITEANTIISRVSLDLSW